MRTGYSQTHLSDLAQIQVKIMQNISEYILNELGEDCIAAVLNPESVATEMPPSAQANEVQPLLVDATEIIVDGRTFITMDGKLFLHVTKGTLSYEWFVASQIDIIADARDINSSNWGKVVRFYDQDGVKKDIFIHNCDIVTNGGAVITELSKEGLVISSGKSMAEALLHFLNLAPPFDKRKAVCTDRIGWHGNIYLFHDNSVIGNTDKRIVYTGAPIGNCNAVKGSVQSWKEEVAAKCKGNTLLLLAICVAFGSVLLRQLKMESGGYHIFGESSTGKTTTLYAAASVNGEPEHMIGTWRTTTNGAEGRAKKHNDSVLIMDELHQSTPKEAGEASYMLFNGKGKQRANVLGGARDVFEWRLNCLSSGETPYAAFILKKAVA